MINLTLKGIFVRKKSCSKPILKLCDIQLNFFQEKKISENFKIVQIKQSNRLL